MDKSSFVLSGVQVGIYIYMSLSLSLALSVCVGFARTIALRYAVGIESSQVSHVLGGKSYKANSA